MVAKSQPPHEDVVRGLLRCNSKIHNESDTATVVEAFNEESHLRMQESMKTITAIRAGVTARGP